MARSQPKGFRSRRSFKVKLIASLSAVILVVFCLSGYISYRIHLDIFETELSKQFAKANEQALLRLELRIQDIYRISDYVVFNPYVEEIIMNSSGEEGGTKYQQYLDRKELDELLNKVKLDAPQLRSLYLYDLNGNRFYINNSLSVNLLGEEEYRSIASNLEGTEGGIVWDRVTLPSSVEQSGFKDVIVASRLMKTPELVTYGVMVMIFDETLFSKFLTTLAERETGRVYIFDQRNQLLYTDESSPYRIPPSDLLALHQTDIRTVNKVPYLLTKSRSEEIDFSLVSSVSLKDMQADSQKIFEVAVYSAILSIVLAGILVTVTGQQLLRPLKLLMKGMQQLRQGNFDTHIEIQTKDELALIGQSFNTMAAHINSLIREVYERQLNEREAELKALQAQLNPHFLYNTLDTIYWELYLKDDLETAKLVVSLSEILRSALEPVNEMITLKDEIHQIQNYLNIQQARFKEDLHAVIRMDEEVEHCLLIRLLLQPLVENVFVHAFRDKETDKLIQIHAYRHSDQLRIEITDNGCGVHSEMLEQLTAGSASATEERKRERLGVKSVIRRIDLVYGKPYGLEMSSERGAGTTMKLILPYQVQNDSKGEAE
ncbi:cache domain-containing sensor histidine kinase [Paenibacillus arenilitoris]|uniref:Histidine kinase n=1 Tax=Paenibacillus arenilitoris TaxID=2772299 RepID=A0A927CM66_9BACL|nr:histidine kinase [Paenibacillus arenilitoris]MBD2869138.1 histidine kinase [Paenibacillus arenilitoris]